MEHAHTNRCSHPHADCVPSFCPCLPKNTQRPYSDVERAEAASWADFYEPDRTTDRWTRLYETKLRLNRHE